MNIGIFIAECKNTKKKAGEEVDDNFSLVWMIVSNWDIKNKFYVQERIVPNIPIVSNSLSIHINNNNNNVKTRLNESK